MSNNKVNQKKLPGDMLRGQIINMRKYSVKTQWETNAFHIVCSVEYMKKHLLKKEKIGEVSKEASNLHLLISK